LSPEAQHQSRQVSVLRVPAPRDVIQRLGNATAELIRTGVLTLYREPLFLEKKQKLEWVDRWGLHSLVRAFVDTKTNAEDRRSGYLAAGTAYQEWVAKPGARWSEQVEGIHHLHSVGEGDRAWPMVQEYVLWLRRQARYREALTLLESCEAAGTTGEQLANALMFQAQMRRQLGERSEDLAQMLVRAARLASSDETKGDVLAEHGSLASDRGQYEEAERLHRQALALTEKALGGTHPSYGTSLHELASVLSRQGKYGEAEDLLRQALTLFEKALGRTHPSYGTTLHELASVLSRQGKYGEAEDLLRQALALFEESLGVAHPSYGASLHELAGVLSRQGKYGEAEDLLRQALTLKEKALGEAHPLMCPTLSNLADVLQAQGRTAEGEPLLQRALTIAREQIGLLNPDVAQILTGLALTQASLGRLEAPETARQALAALNETLGSNHPITQQAAPI